MSHRDFFWSWNLITWLGQLRTQQLHNIKMPHIAVNSSTARPQAAELCFVRFCFGFSSKVLDLLLYDKLECATKKKSFSVVNKLSLETLSQSLHCMPV